MPPPPWKPRLTDVNPRLHAIERGEADWVEPLAEVPTNRRSSRQLLAVEAIVAARDAQIAKARSGRYTTDPDTGELVRKCAHAACLLPRSHNPTYAPYCEAHGHYLWCQRELAARFARPSPAQPSSSPAPSGSSRETDSPGP